MTRRYRHSMEDERDPRGYTRKVITSRLPDRLRVELPAFGQIELADRGAVVEFAHQLEYMPPGSDWERILIEGVYSDPDTGQVLEPKAAELVRSMMLGYSELAPDTTGDEDDDADVSWLVRGLWQRGTCPQLSGPAKGGKTTLVRDLLFTLLIEGHKFLGKFERGDVTPADLWAGVVVINSEMPRPAFNRALAPLKAVQVEVEDPDGNRFMVSARSLVKAYHLRSMGGPAVADFLNPRVIEKWRRELLLCIECLGGDNLGPLAVILDNGSAILRATQRGPIEHSGEMFEGFRSLLTETLASAGLYVSHSDKAGSGVFGGVQAAAPSDGEWMLSGYGPGAHRYFSVTPRLEIGEAIEPTRVDLDPEGNPVMVSGQSHSSTAAAPVFDARAEILRMLTEAGGKKLTTGELIGSGGHGQELRPALKELHAEARVSMEKQGQTMFWSLPVSRPQPDIRDTDSAAVQP